MTEALPQHRLQKGFRWPGRTLWDDVARHGVRRGDAPAVTDEHGTYTYRELAGAVTRLAHHYREVGVGHALGGPYGQYWTADFGLSSGGGVPPGPECFPDRPPNAPSGLRVTSVSPSPANP